MLSRSTCFTASLVLSLLTLVGCGGSQSSLIGQVTLDGSPVIAEGDINGTVVLNPKKSGTPPATGRIDMNGKYEVTTGASSGLTPGEYLVTVNVLKVLPAKVEGNPPWAERISDPKYKSVKTSGLSVTIEPGRNTFDIDIESKKTGR